MDITLSSEEAELLLNLMINSHMDDKDDTFLEYDCFGELMNKLLKTCRKFDEEKGD
jgi:hypothetical protein